MSRKIEILLGDNPLFGVDHLSQERARERSKILMSFEKIIEIIKSVSNIGVNGFVVSTYPQLKDLIDIMKKDAELFEKIDFYLILPYAQGYVTKATEKGTVGAINDILSKVSTQKKIKILFDGSLGFLKKDFEKLFKTFVDIELYPFENVRKKTIFLHDVLTDIAISLNMKSVIETFNEYVKDKYNAECGLVTKNFPLLITSLNDWELQIPKVMTSFNSIGFQMNPSKEECEKYLKFFDNVIAMNTLAGGFLNPQDAAKYISNLNIKSVVIGMSNIEHANETINAFRN